MYGVRKTRAVKCKVNRQVNDTLGFKKFFIKNEEML